MNLRHRGQAPARMLIDIIPFVLSYVTTASGGGGKPRSGGAAHPRGKGRGKAMGIPTSGLTQHSLA